MSGVPPLRVRRPPEVLPDERKLLWELIELLKDTGAWVPKKPEKTVYNFGHDITDKTLPPGTWTKIFTLPADYTPYVVYWKILVADTPYIKCLPYMNGRPASPRGIDLRDLFNNGVWQANDRVWCHIYDTVSVPGRYGLTFNVVEPVVGDYDFYIRNDDPDGDEHTLTYLYLKWYQWEERHIVKVY